MWTKKEISDRPIETGRHMQKYTFLKGAYTDCPIVERRNDERRKRKEEKRGKKRNGH